MKPSKLTNRVIEAFETVLSDELNMIVCTDEELYILVNDLLNEHEQISYRSFQRYKAKAMEHGLEVFNGDQWPDEENVLPIGVEKQRLIAKLYLLLRKATIKMKRSIMSKIRGKL